MFNLYAQRSTKGTKGLAKSFVLFVLLCGLNSGGDDRIRTCEGLLTLNGLANRRLQPLGHISVPDSAKTNSSREPEFVKEDHPRSSAAKFSLTLRAVQSTLSCEVRWRPNKT